MNHFEFAESASWRSKILHIAQMGNVIKLRRLILKPHRGDILVNKLNCEPKPHRGEIFMDDSIKCRHYVALVNFNTFSYQNIASLRLNKMTLPDEAWIR